MRGAGIFPLKRRDARGTPRARHKMSENNHEEVCREMLDLFHDAAKENKIPEGLFHACSNHLMRLRKLHDSEKTISYSVPYPCFSVHDGPLDDASLRAVGMTLDDPHSPLRIKTFEWYMQMKVWIREVKSKEEDIIFSHRRIERLYKDLQKCTSLDSITRKHKTLAVQKSMTYTEYLNWYNLNQEKKREDFCRRIRMQLNRMTVMERMRQILVSRIRETGSSVDENVTYEPCSSMGGGFVIYHDYRSRWMGRRPIFDRSINVFSPSCVMKIWRAVRRDKGFLEDGQFFSALLVIASRMHREDLARAQELNDSCPGSPA